MDGQRLVSDYLDGRLAPQERASFEARLVIDADLARELEAMSATLALLRALPTEAPPADMAARIMAEVRLAPAPARRGSWAFWRAGLRLRPLLVTAAAAAAVFGLVLLNLGGSDGPNVRLSSSDEAFVGECLVDYHLAASDRYKHGPATPGPTEPANNAAQED